MEARALAHALTVIAHARARLDDARSGAESVRKKFNEGLGWYWKTIGQTLARDGSLGPHYKDFVNALKELDEAIAKARLAGDRLMDAALAQDSKG